MGDGRGRTREAVFNVISAAALLGVAYYFLGNVLTELNRSLADPEKEKKERARIQARENLQRIRNRQIHREEGDDGREYSETMDTTDGTRHGVRVEDLQLNEYEDRIALEVVAPEDISVGFDNIGGLEDIIEELKEAVIYPLTMPQLYAHAAPLLSAPPGVLLYGPPGCGKTMLAKALARESGASFINLHISTLTEKWFGDSNKMVKAVFSLARKLEPSIVFIDEIDAVLGTRTSGEHEASGQVKAEFMTLWDGLTSASAAGTPARIVVLGATNRIRDIDEAILRRMPKKFPIPLPTKGQRLRILELILRDTKLDPTFDIDYIARVTAGMSGSDIKEACRDAAMLPMREFIREHKASGKSMSRIDPRLARGVKTGDFFGRAGTGQILVQNHEREFRDAERKERQQKQRQGSSDEYEDVEDGEPVGEAPD